MNVRARILKFLNGLDIKEAEKEIAGLEARVQECLVVRAKTLHAEDRLRHEISRSRDRLRFLKQRERKLLQAEEFA